MNWIYQKSELGCLRREVERMSELEGECVLKDDLIDQLREEVTNLQNFVRHIEVDRCPMCQRNATGNTATGPVSSIQQTTGTTQVWFTLYVVLADEVFILLTWSVSNSLRMPAIAAILFYWIRMKVFVSLQEISYCDVSADVTDCCVSVRLWRRQAAFALYLLIVV